MLSVSGIEVTTTKRPSLRRLGGGLQPRVRVICFPWAGAGASVFRRFAMSFPSTIEVWAVQLPGREDRFGQERLTRMEQMVDEVLKDVARLLDRPVVFFGHSMGALIAYEVARALAERRWHDPRLLIVSGQGSPESVGRDVFRTRNATEYDLIEDLRRLGGTPPAVLEDRQALTAFLPVLQADYQALDHYIQRPSLSLACPIIALGSTGDPSLSREEVEAWSQYTKSSFTQYWFGGDHFFVSAQSAELALSVQKWIAAAELQGNWRREG